MKSRLLTFPSYVMMIGLVVAGSLATQAEEVPHCIEDWVKGGYFTEFEGKQVFVHGSGPRGKEGVLVVHGYPGSSWDFAGVVGPVSHKTRVVVPDMIGFGQSDTPLTGKFKENFSLMKQADLYEAVVAEEGLETVILVAHDMGQTVGVELMARQEEGRLPFRIKHAILLNGSTLVDMVRLTEWQKEWLELPDHALAEAAPREEWFKDIRPSYGAKMQADQGALNVILECQVAQIYTNDSALVMTNVARYLLEREEFYDRWVGTLANFRSAPMTVFWGTDDRISIAAMADRIKAWRPQTDVYKLEGIGHWPSIEAPEVISEAILHRLPSE